MPCAVCGPGQLPAYQKCRLGAAEIIARGETNFSKMTRASSYAGEEMARRYGTDGTGMCVMRHLLAAK